MFVSLVANIQRKFLIYFSEACLHAYPTATLETIDSFIGSYLRHAPARASGSKRQVSSLAFTSN
jgi:hypothetical protein